MALTRIKSQSILDREVREQDLADSAITFDKLRLIDSGDPGDVLTVDASGNLLFAPADGTPRTLNQIEDVSVGGALNNQVLSYNSTTGLWRAVTIPGLSDSNNTYIVADIAGRNALTPNEADQCFVRSGFSGEWEMYLYDSGFPGGPWVLIATADSARTDANTIEYTIAWDAAGSPITIGNVSNGSRVTVVTVDIDAGSEFDAAGITFSIGDAGDVDRLMTLDYIDLETEGSYVATPDYVYSSATDTDILLTFDFGGATQGTARVVVTHV
jgi:hypothetical protein